MKCESLVFFIGPLMVWPAVICKITCGSKTSRTCWDYLKETLIPGLFNTFIRSLGMCKSAQRYLMLNVYKEPAKTKPMQVKLNWLHSCITASLVKEGIIQKLFRQLMCLDKISASFYPLPNHSRCFCFGLILLWNKRWSCTFQQQREDC